MRTRKLPDSNYSSIFINGKTLRIPIDTKKPITELAWPEFYDISPGNKCATGKCDFCFLPGNIVYTEKGITNIEDIKIGDMVHTLNEVSGKLEVKEVSQLHQKEYDGEIITIELDNDKIITCTSNHKVLTKRGWITAGGLLTSDILVELSDIGDK